MKMYFIRHIVYSGIFYLRYFGAAGGTENELKQVLELDWAKKKKMMLRIGERGRSNQLQNQSIEFTLADKLYIDHIKFR